VIRILSSSGADGALDNRPSDARVAQDKPTKPTMRSSATTICKGRSRLSTVDPIIKAHRWLAICGHSRRTFPGEKPTQPINALTGTGPSSNGTSSSAVTDFRRIPNKRSDTRDNQASIPLLFFFFFLLPPPFTLSLPSFYPISLYSSFALLFISYSVLPPLTHHPPAHRFILLPILSP